MILATSLGEGTKALGWLLQAVPTLLASRSLGFLQLAPRTKRSTFPTLAFPPAQKTSDV